MKEELLKRQNGRCALCGAINDDMEFEHIIPFVSGGTDTLDNLVLICTHHNRQLGNRNLREFEFLEFLVRLLNENKSFTDTLTDIKINPEKRHRADIVVTEKIDTDDIQKVLIEIKSFSNFTKSRFESIVEQLRTYEDQINEKVKKVFAFPGIISADDKEIFTSKEIEVWDLNYLLKRFKDEISKPHNQKFLIYFGLIRQQESLSEEKKLIQDLKSIKPGREDWSKYQNHIGKILDYLFGDILSSPIVESADEYGVNRRDFIIRNYVDSGFWKFLRERYKADFIVIDAKNYTKGVKKKEVLQICNYLKEKGTGLFAIIISRIGEKKSSYLTRRDKWVIENKMVIVLTDDDIEQMILSKASSDDPEEIIKQRLEEFRLKI